MLKKIIAAFSVFLLLLILSWVFNHSFVEFKLTGATAETTFTLTNKSGETNVFKSEKNTVKKLVSRGTYVLTTTREDKSSLNTIKAGGFLGTVSTTLELKPETGKQYIGNNPAPCMSYINNVLFSFECTSLINEVNVHQPATNGLPTYVIKNENVPDSTLTNLESIVDTKLGKLLLSQTESGEHTVTVVSSGVSSIGGVRLSSLDPDLSYKLAGYGDGFVAYNETLKSVFYYATINARPVKINLAISDQTLKPIDFRTDGRIISVLYSNSEGEDRPVGGRADRSIVVLYSQNKAYSYEFDLKLNSAAPCGKKLCLYSDGLLDIYSYEATEKKYDFSVYGARGIESFGDKTLIPTDVGVLELNTESRTGFYSYTSGKYKICGLQPVLNGYIVCAIDTRNNKVALLVNGSGDATIDKKIIILESSNQLKTVSAYKNYIHISPELGGLITDANGTFAYDPVQITNSQTTIDRLLKKANITQEYLVINSAL